MHLAKCNAQTITITCVAGLEHSQTIKYVRKPIRQVCWNSFDINLVYTSNRHQAISVALNASLTHEVAPWSRVFTLDDALRFSPQPYFSAVRLQSLQHTDTVSEMLVVRKL